MAMLNRRRAILIGIEDNYNHDPGLTGAANGVYVSNLSSSLEDVQMIEDEGVKATFGKLQSVYAGALRAVTFDIPLKGNGTAGEAPECAPILRALGMSEVLTGGVSAVYTGPASQNIPSLAVYYLEDGKVKKITGARPVSASLNAEKKGMLSVTLVGHMHQQGAATAGAASTITLDASSATVDDVHNGQTIEIIRGTGVGQSRTITDYVGSTKVATVGVAWATVPDATSVYKIDNGPVDKAFSNPAYDQTPNVPFIQAGFTIGSYEPIISKIALDFGLVVAKQLDVNSPDGFGELEITDANLTGSYDPNDTLIATKDWEGEFKAGTVMALDTGTIGKTAGNQWRLQLAKTYHSGLSGGEREGISTNEITFATLETSGDDVAVFTFT